MALETRNLGVGPASYESQMVTSIFLNLGEKKDSWLHVLILHLLSINSVFNRD